MHVHWQWLAVFMLLVASPAQASVQEIRIVGVGIDNSSMKANEQALDYARKRAVFLAARKLGVKDANKLVAKFTEREFNEIIRGATVTQTRRRGYVTFADVTVTIVDETLKRTLRLPENFGKPVALSPTMRGVLLLPVLAGQDRAYMWEKENELRAPLIDEVRRQSHGMVLLPGGDLDDLRLVDYQNALTVKPDELKPMFERYGAEEIIIAVLSLSKPGTADASSVLLRRLQLQGESNEVMEIPVTGLEESSVDRLNNSVNAIAAAITQIASSTSEREQAIRRAATKLTVRFSYAVPKEFAKMQEMVREDPQVLYLDMPSIALAQVAGTIYLKGDYEALRQNLIKKGVIVTAINDGWRLSLR